MKSLLILGAGGFGRMVAETAQALGYDKVVFLDDAVKDEAVIGMCCDYEIRHKEYPVAVAAFGNNKMRLYWTDSHGAACIMYRILCAIRWWRDRNSSISRHSALAIF